MSFPLSRSLRRAAVFALLTVTVAAGLAIAAPHDGDRFVLEQPDGTKVPVRVWGDEYYQRIEDLDGYTLIRDPRSYEICYADLAADGRSFVSTGVLVGDPPPAGLARGLRLPTAVRAELAREVRQEFERLDAARLADKTRDPEPSNQGAVLGLTLIIDFSDEPGTIPAGDFADYLNLPGYNGYGNNGSVRDYFYDVSGGALEYTNWVPSSYLRAPQPKTYYEDPSVQYGQRARQLVLWALTTLENQGHDFSQYDANGDGYIDAINVFYAGFPTGGWSVGLWPHSSSVTFGADGVSAYRYQITNIGTALRLGTFCHENGHMIMFWPDLYDYGYESSGVGQFCLMCSSGGTNPVRPCAYLRAEAGWVEPVILEGLQGGLVASHDDMNVFKIPYEGVPNEYYMVENRNRTGRDAGLPDAGLAIWHIDEFGSNDNEQQTPNLHYLVTLVQADGRWDLENGVNNGDASDLWKAPNYVEFNPSTTPAALWWDGRDAPVYIDEVSTPGSEMTFSYREGLGTMGVTIEPLPAALEAAWTLEGPNGYLVEGAGYRSLLVWDEGVYTLTWSDMPGWTEPDPLQSSFEMVDGGAPAYFSGTYTDPPFALVAGGAAADPGPAAAVSPVDVDGDGDVDLHLVNAGQADRLLRNDGGLVFTDITPPELADTGAGSAAAWGDYDNDGDRDLFLVRDGEANRLLEQEGGVFTDVTALSVGLGDAGPGSDVAWCDADADGKLDLYLVQDGAPNIFYHNFGDLGSGHPMLLAQTPDVLAGDGPGRAAVWCDYDRDGDRDVYLVNDWNQNLLVRSYNGTAFEPSGESAMTDDGPGQDAVWGDFDNDGDWDAYTVNGDRDDVLCLWTLGYFARQFDPVVNDDGPGRAVAAADFDNDGVLDLYVARDGAADMLLFGDGAGGFTRSLLAVDQTAGGAVSVVCADLDEDGGVDVYLARDGQENLILRNQVVGRGHWLGLDLRGDPANRDAIGARVRVVAGGVSQLREVKAGDGHGEVPRVLHLGLGAAATADSVIVTWPDGEQSLLLDQLGDRTLAILQTEDPTGVDGSAGLPRVTRLQGAYPNPFNPRTTVAFELATAGPVRLSVYGLDGRRVVDLVRESLPAGAHTVSWAGRDASGRAVASGTYLLRLETRGGAWNSRIALLK
jgi:M6 family metalloprotease-like protein